MKRTEIVDGVLQVVTALEESGMDTALNLSIDSRRAPSRDSKINKQILVALRSYQQLSSHFSEAARNVSRIMDLAILLDPDFWMLAITESDEVSAMVFRARNRVHFAMNNLPILVSLLKQDYPTELEKAGEGQERVLTLLLFESPNSLSKAERVVEAIESIRLLYEVAGGVLDQDPSTLAVIACDSGSDKSFDFLGIAKVIEQTKEIILEIWTRLTFLKEARVKQQFELVSQSLPIYEQISVLEGKKAIQPEQAEILRRKLANGLEKFLTSGAAIPELEAKAYSDPRLLLAPAPKLLAEHSVVPDSTPKTIDETAMLDSKKQQKKARAKKAVIRTSKVDLSKMSDEELDKLIDQINQKRNKPGTAQ